MGILLCKPIQLLSVCSRPTNQIAVFSRLNCKCPQCEVLPCAIAIPGSDSMQYYTELAVLPMVTLGRCDTRTCAIPYSTSRLPALPASVLLVQHAFHSYTANFHLQSCNVPIVLNSSSVLTNCASPHSAVVPWYGVTVTSVNLKGSLYRGGYKTER